MRVYVDLSGANPVPRLSQGIARRRFRAEITIYNPSPGFISPGMRGTGAIHVARASRTRRASPGRMLRSLPPRPALDNCLRAMTPHREPPSDRHVGRRSNRRRASVAATAVSPAIAAITSVATTAPAVRVAGARRSARSARTTAVHDGIHKDRQYEKHQCHPEDAAQRRA